MIRKQVVGWGIKFSCVSNFSWRRFS